MADEGFLISEEYLAIIEDLRSRVNELEGGTAQLSTSDYEIPEFVRLTELGDVSAPSPFPFGELVPYKAEGVIWNRVASAAYGWEAIDPTFDPDAAAAAGIVQEYIFAANGTIGLEGTVHRIERRSAQTGSQMIDYWFICVNGEGQMAEIKAHDANGEYTAYELDFEGNQTGKEYGVEFPKLIAMNLAEGVAAGTKVQVVKKKGIFWFEDPPAGGEGFNFCTTASNVYDAEAQENILTLVTKKYDSDDVFIEDYCTEEVIIPCCNEILTCGTPNDDPTIMVTMTWLDAAETKVFFGCEWENGETKEMYATNYTLASGTFPPATGTSVIGGAGSYDEEFWTILATAGTNGLEHLKLRHNRSYRSDLFFNGFPTTPFVPQYSNVKQKVEFAGFGWFSSKNIHVGYSNTTGTGYAIGTIPPDISLNGAARTGPLTINQPRLDPAMLTGIGTTDSFGDANTMSWELGNGW